MFSLNRRMLLFLSNRSQTEKCLMLIRVLESNQKLIACSTNTKSKVRSKVITNDKLSPLFTPLPVHPSVEESGAGSELSGEIKKTDVIKAINGFYRKPELRVLAEDSGLDNYILQKGFISFRKYCLESENLPTDLHIVFSDIIKNQGNLLDIYPYFLNHVRQMFPHLECIDDLKKIGDLRSPADWYPEARSMTRKIIIHCGPTNSGKTYHAVQRFFNAKSGIYCGPLKLLAVEIFNKANEYGTPCDLVTGEEIVYVKPDGDHVDHVSCTIEMCSLEKTYDVAIIDEIQMIKDPQRGYAWTRALLGLRAKEIHICGEDSVNNLIDSILCTTNENFEVVKYKRLTELEVCEPLGNLESVKPGDCIVCFNKADIYYVTRRLENLGHEVSVIYGSLPPGTKLAQCKKFNDPNHPCKVLVATDAIGMGLNLGIKRIIFYSVTKYAVNEAGEMEMVPLSVSQTLQIAGRAGRFGTQYDKGYVTTLRPRDLPVLKELLKKSPEPVMSAGLLPTVDQIELYSYFLPNSKLSNLLEIFINLSTVDDSLYFLCDIKDFKFLAELIEHIKLPLRVKYVFCCAPINKKSQFLCTMFVKFARLLSENRLVSFNWLCKNIHWPLTTPKNMRELLRLEEVHDVLDLYLWLSYRFPEYFSDGDFVKQIQRESDRIIEEGVVNMTKLLKESDTMEECVEELKTDLKKKDRKGLLRSRKYSEKLEYNLDLKDFLEDESPGQ